MQARENPDTASQAVFDRMVSASDPPRRIHIPAIDVSPRPNEMGIPTTMSMAKKAANITNPRNIASICIPPLRAQLFYSFNVSYNVRYKLKAQEKHTQRKRNVRYPERDIKEASGSEIRSPGLLP
jgi:hypothetical protein